MPTLSSFGLKNTQKVNSRNAQAIVAEQDRQRQISQATNVSIPNGASDAQRAAVRGITPGVNAPTDYQVPQPSATPGVTIYNQPDPNSTPLPASTGVIQDSERKRLKDAGFTDAQILEREAALKQDIKRTASDTGMRSADSSGAQIANTQLRSDPAAQAEAKKKADQAAKVAAAKGYVKVTNTDKNGNTTESYVEDPNATKKAQQDAENANAAQNAADAQGASNKQSFNEANPEQVGGADAGATAPPLPPMPSPDSFIASLPPEQQAQAKAIFGPIFQYLGQAQQYAQAQLGVGMDAVNQSDSLLQNYVSSQRAQNQQLFDMFKGFNDDSLKAELDSAERTAEADERINDFNQRKAESQFSRAIRDQMVKNEKDRHDQLLGLGISGGWKSSRHSAEVLTALKQGDNILADLETDSAFSGEYFNNKSIEIKESYQGNISTAYSKYKAGNLALFDKMSERASVLDKTVYDSTQSKIAAVASLKGTFIKSIGDLAADMASTVKEQNKWVIDTAAQAKKDEFDNQQNVWTQAMKYIDTYGTQNRPAIMHYEQQLGLAPGSLSNQKTIEELKMKKAGGGGGGGGSGGIGNVESLVTAERNRLKALYPFAEASEIDNLAYGNIYTLQGGGTEKGRSVMQDVFSYMNTKPIDGQQYNVVPFAPDSTMGRQNIEDIQQVLDHKYVLSTGKEDPNDLYNSLVASKDDGGPGFTEKQATDYMSKLGYADVPNWWFSSNFQKTK